jgi:L-iditol 2-dehydrogenase
MKIVSITGSREAALVEHPMPVARGHFVVVKILAAPMCCEYKDYQKGVNYALGHEAAGEVVEVDQSHHVKVGDRVVIMPLNACGKCSLCLAGDYIHCETPEGPGPDQTGTYGQYQLKADHLLVPIPKDVSTEHAVMACCGLGPTFGAMQAMNVNAFDTVLITGMGPVGLGGVINGTFRGARVIAVESNPYRKDLAKSLGADAVVDPTAGDAKEAIMKLTNNLGVDKALDCSGVAVAQRLMIDSVRRKGEIAFVGEAGELTVHVSNDLIRKGLTLRGIWHYNRGDIPKILQVIRQSSAKLDKLITHRFPMSRVREAFELQLTGQCGKVILDPQS